MYRESETHMNKNEIVTVEIEDLSRDGSGIGHVDGYTLFVKDALIGDTVRAKITKPKKSYAYARCEEVLTPSPDRCQAPCANARRCGGCRLQEMNYEAQLRFKTEQVRDVLVRIGGFSEEELCMKPIIGMDDPFRYRNKAQYPIGRVKDHLAAGFYAGRTHSIIELDDCLLTKEVNAGILTCFMDHMKRYGISAYNEETGKGLVRHLLIREGFTSGEILVCPVINGRELPHASELVSELRKIDGIRSICLNVNTKKGNKILGNEVISLYGDPWITDTLGGLTFRISPLSFYQVNPVQCEKLYTEALEGAGLTGNEIVYDLYCGIGTISLFLAKKAKEVYGVEIVPAAIEDAKRNAAENGITNAHFYVGAAEDLVVSGKFDDNTPCPKADVVCVDPPRKGCAPELIDAVLTMAPKRIVYVSCDPATLARDLKLLTRGNADSAYRLESVRPVDMFPQTNHCENVCVLSRIKEDQRS